MKGLIVYLRPEIKHNMQRIYSNVEQKHISPLGCLFGGMRLAVD
jgi:hypothetical protein